MKDAPDITPELLLQAYAAGVFPMAESRDDPELFWVAPTRRGIFPLPGFHVSRSLRRRLLSAPFRITYDQDFAGVIDGCASRESTWISGTIRALYLRLFEMGHAHSVEVWEEGTLVGGVYGVTLGAAFFGESMFSRRTDASKIALAYLTDRLKRTGFTLFDTQYLTSHLASLGAIEIPKAQYHARLADALAHDADFTAPLSQTPYEVAQRRTQTS